MNYLLIGAKIVITEDDVVINIQCILLLRLNYIFLEVEI